MKNDRRYAPQIRCAWLKVYKSLTVTAPRKLVAMSNAPRKLVALIYLGAWVIKMGDAGGLLATLVGVILSDRP